MATADDDEVTFRLDTGYDTISLEAHQKQLEQTMAAVRKRIAELSVERDSSFARRDLRSVFDDVNGQYGDQRHLSVVTRDSDRHSTAIPSDRRTVAQPSALTTDRHAAAEPTIIPTDRQLGAIPKMDRHSTDRPAGEEHWTTGSLHGSLHGGASMLQPETVRSPVPTRSRTGLGTMGLTTGSKQNLSSVTAESATVAGTGSARGKPSSLSSIHRSTGRELPQIPRKDGSRDVNSPKTVVPSSSTIATETPQNDRLSADSDPSLAPLRRVTPTIKLGSYDGVAIALETHLSKLDNCASYYNWSARDRLCHLKASLEGPAGQVLWEIGIDATEADIVKLLRNRFGNVNQMERYRAELRSRRRKRGESVQSVYQDIRRLLALGFPGQSGELCEIIGRDAFLEALADPALRIRVLDQSPSTLDEALSIVCRMEAYGGATSSHDDDGSEDQLAGRRKVRAVNASSVVDVARVKQLEETVAAQSREIQQLRIDAEKQRGDMVRASVVPTDRPRADGHQPGAWAHPSWLQPSTADHPAVTQGGWSNGQMYYNSQQPYSYMPPSTSIVGPSVSSPPEMAPSGGQIPPRRGRRVQRDTCRLCLLPGHWQRECPQRIINRHHHRPVLCMALSVLCLDCGRIPKLTWMST